jgi:hypothetical protein
VKRIALASAAAAVAAAACLATLEWLGDDAPADVARPAAPAPGVAPPPPASAAPPSREDPSLDGGRLASTLARSADAREEALRAAIQRIGDDETLTLDARLERYREALQAAMAGASVPPAFGNGSMQAEWFLRMPGVQRELAALGPGARAEELARIRRALGFDDEQIARLAEIDARREARWEIGRAYMEERARVVATFEGETREAELRALREEHFAHEAPTIEREEQGGFFRFERPRVYGRN